MNGPVSRTDRHDEYGRPWGTPLWAGGPILGGANWKAWVRQSVEREADEYRIDSETVVVDHSRDAQTRRRAALKYALAALGSGSSPLPMVEAILAGDRDDVVRTIL